MASQDPPEEWLMSRRRALWRVVNKRRYDRPDGSRLTVKHSVQYAVVASAVQAESLVRRRIRAVRDAIDCGGGEIMWWDCDCERVRWMDEPADPRPRKVGHED